MPKHRRGGAREGLRHLPVSVVARDDGSSALKVGGFVQSVAWPPDAPPDAGTLFAVGYWEEMLPPTCPRNALLLGLGGGTVAWLLARRCPGVTMTGIEADALILATARAEMGLDDIPGLTVVQGDAFAWMLQAVNDPSTPRYDYIAVDLFEAGRLIPGALATPFLRQVATLLAPGGMVAFNLFVSRRIDEQRHRLNRVFSIERERRHVGNLIVFARPLNGAQPAPSTPDTNVAGETPPSS